MLHLIYIGRHADTIEQFSKIAEGAFYAIQNSRKASEFIDKIREKYDIVILFEQRIISKDIPEIQYLRKKFPGVYMISTKKEQIYCSSSSLYGKDYLISSSLLSPYYVCRQY